MIFAKVCQWYRSRTAVLALAAMLLVPCQTRLSVASPPERAPQISTWARAFRPGEVVLVTVRADRGVDAVEGTAFGGSLAFWSIDGAWRALAGIPIDTKPGSYGIVVHARDTSGERTTAQASIEVAAHTFRTRRLQVDERFVTPPASEAVRIASEAKLLASVFAGRLPSRLWQGPFVVPVPGPANSSFGRLSIYNGKPSSRHQGTDFQAAAGTPIVAPNAGVVVLASDLYFSGNTVVIDHGEGLFSLMAHLSRIAVGVGSSIAKGDRVGDVGATGRVTGPHLHWAVRLGGVSVDPLSLMAAIAVMK